MLYIFKMGDGFKQWVSKAEQTHLLSSAVQPLHRRMRQ